MLPLYLKVPIGGSAVAESAGLETTSADAGDGK
jgi:hypothetical protein